MATELFKTSESLKNGRVRAADLRRVQSDLQNDGLWNGASICSLYACCGEINTAVIRRIMAMMQNEAARGPAYKPEDGNRIFIEAMRYGDIETIVALYEPDAVLVRPDGKKAIGHVEIRKFLEQEAARKASYVIQDIATVLSYDGSIAVTRMRMSVSWTGRDGKQNTIQTRTMEIMRKQPDGTWRFVIDSPLPEMIQ
jgi:uncharacterized protein (TIGR02246 family)